jgi:hypothetical protein
MIPSIVQSPNMNLRSVVGQVTFSGNSSAKSAKESSEGRDVFQRRTSESASLNIPNVESDEINYQLDSLLLELRENQSTLSPEILQDLTLNPDEKDDFEDLLKYADSYTQQLEKTLMDLREGKPISAPVLPEGHPLKAVFAKQTEDLKARQKREQVELAKSNGIKDTPELRAELLKQGVVSDESEIPAFLEKFGL